jgi:putative ABC transport system permease protein
MEPPDEIRIDVPFISCPADLSILTTIGIIIGVASVTAVIGALTGLKTKVLAEMQSFGVNSFFVNPAPGTRDNYRRSIPWEQWRFRPEHFKGVFEHCPSVAFLDRVVWCGQTDIRFRTKQVEGTRVYGVEPAWHRIEGRPVALGREFSALDNDLGRYVCFIDPKLRDELGMDIDCIGQTVFMFGKMFSVIGVVEMRPDSILGQNTSVNEVFIPFGTALKMNRIPWIYAEGASKSTNVVQEALAEITFFLRKTRDVKPGEPDTFEVQASQNRANDFDQIARLITLVAAGVVGVSLIVGGIGIMNIMLVSVSERTREIGLRKAVGAKKYAVLTQFLVEAVVLSLVGGLIGIVLGQLITTVISRINPVMNQTRIPVWAILISFGFAATVGIVFGIFPAIKAARLDPIEALRHE